MKPSNMPDIAGAFRIRREMRKRKQDTNRVSCRDCQWWDPHAENYACSVCPVTDDTANVTEQTRAGSASPGSAGSTSGGVA